MSRGLVAKQSVRIDAGAARVWDALVNPATIQRYMFGTTAVSQWTPGSTITFKGEWQGKHYEDHGVIRRVEPGRVLEYTYFSPLSGLPDSPENYHTVTLELSAENGATLLVLSQDNNATEQTRMHSEKNWAGMLAGLKKLLEEPQ